jgi:hypothetical protein
MSIKLLPDLEDLVEGFGVSGIMAILLLSTIVPGASNLSRPLVKAVVKGGIVLYEKGKGVVAEVSGALKDILAEAKGEVAEAKAKGIETTSVAEVV